MTHFPRLDGLRGLALLAVFVNHFLPVPGAHHFGWLGVDLFFVLSGFLITGILLRDRDGAEAAGRGRRGVWLRFMARRSLRIFPAYFLVVGLAVVLGDPEAVRAAPYLFTYTYNFWVIGHGLNAPVSHLWSLCLEEQFYLVWPFVALFWPRRLFVPLALALVAFAPVWRYYASARTGGAVQAAQFLPPGSADCLVMGALAALALRRGPDSAARMRRACLALGGVGMAGWYVLANWHYPVWMGPPVDGRGGTAGAEWVVGNSVAAVFFAGVVLSAVNPSPQPRGDLLLWPPLRYVGRISYGLYLYHMFVVSVFVKYHSWLHPWQVPAMYASVALSFAVAVASYHLFESPINSLKRYLEPKRAAPALPAGPARLAA